MTTHHHQFWNAEKLIDVRIEETFLVAATSADSSTRPNSDSSAEFGRSSKDIMMIQRQEKHLRRSIMIIGFITNEARQMGL